MPNVGVSAKREVEQLEKFERKRAAIETVFTIAILYVSVLQIIPVSGTARYGALIPVIVLLGTALYLGGGNLLEQLGIKETGEAT